MKIRIIQLINNFYKDGKNCQDKDEDRYRKLGDYCAFGYFDAVEVLESESISNVKDGILWREIQRKVNEMADGTCNRRNLICIVKEELKDRDFWKKQRNYPYIFVSLIRVRHTANTAVKLKEAFERINKKDTAIAYYSYNHSEMVMVKLEKNYSAGLKFVLEERTQIDILNMYSIFAVKEDILKVKSRLLNEIANEHVGVRLHIIIKDDSLIDHFLNLFMKETGLSEKNVHKYHTLGSCDMLFEIETVNLQKLLPCYCMGRILTHTNSNYEKAVYNIETELLAEREKIENGELDNGKNK